MANCTIPKWESVQSPLLQLQLPEQVAKSLERETRMAQLHELQFRCVRTVPQPQGKRLSAPS